jgi:alkanesulfonate monooxygenase SsuD/methylene tetrahydromethanopterin reductase-like flavin-dependent oxidoreductase (luciferase family)
MRFDMRAPNTGAPAADLYDAALEMCAWGETRGAVAAVLCEHHMSPDGYLPSPLILASAIAARTERLRMMIAVFHLPLYSPIRLAEDICVLDIISRGRISFIGAVGYVPYEYEMHGVDFHRRGAIAEQNLPVLLKAVTGEPFEYEGRRIQVTPAPFTPGGPRIGWGGGSVAAARRAGKYGMDFLGQRSDPALREAYDQAVREHGRQPGNFVMANADETGVVFVAEDVDAAWAELGPYLMHDVLSYAAWNEGNTDTSSISFTKTAEELRAENRSHRIISVAEAVEMVRAGNFLRLHPLIGGLPPAIAWRYLKTVVEKVMPAVGAVEA